MGIAPASASINAHNLLYYEVNNSNYHDLTTNMKWLFKEHKCVTRQFVSITAGTLQRFYCKMEYKCISEQTENKSNY